MKHMIMALALLVASAQASAAVEEKNDICHFDLDLGVWELISVSGNALDAHLENHDDSTPGEPSVATLTPLDGNCEEVVSSLGDCPCWTVAGEPADAALSTLLAVNYPAHTYEDTCYALPIPTTGAVGLEAKLALRQGLGPGGGAPIVMEAEAGATSGGTPKLSCNTYDQWFTPYPPLWDGGAMNNGLTPEQALDCVLAIAAQCADN